MLTITTHRGLFQYNRLPFGVKSAPAIFLQTMDTMLAGIQGVVAYLYDVIVAGRAIEEHSQNLHALFQRIVESGLHVCMNKCKLADPDPGKIEAIQKMPVPKDLSQL